MAAVSVGNRTDENLTSNALETSFSRSIRFWILLPCGILSINCCLLLLYYFVRVRKLRRALNNHVLIIAILLELLYLLIDIPLYLNFLRLGIRVAGSTQYVSYVVVVQQCSAGDRDDLRRLGRNGKTYSDLSSSMASNEKETNLRSLPSDCLYSSLRCFVLWHDDFLSRLSTSLSVHRGMV